jgi:predicted MFS family arabinose efflux permease
MITSLQIINAVAFWIEAFYINHGNLIIIMLHTMLVGIISGAIYGNVFLLVNNSRSILHEEQDISIAMCQIIFEIGTLLGALLTWILADIIGYKSI